MSFAPRFVTDVRDFVKLIKSVEEVLKAARSAMRIAGWASIEPRREMRRPAWSELSRLVNVSIVEDVSGKEWHANTCLD